jgi:hypothetical protein
MEKKTVVANGAVVGGVTSKGWRVGTREADKTISTQNQRMRVRKDEDETRMRD